MKIRQDILTSIEPIVKDSKFVSIDAGKLESFARKIKDQPLPGWDNELQFLGSPSETIQYYFFVDSINFCFWAERGKEKWQYKKGNEWISGYYAFALAIKRFFENDPQFFDAQKLADISFERFTAIFAGRSELQFLEKRHEIVRENFGILKNKYDGQAVNLVKEAKGDVNTLISKIIEEFPSFRDWIDFDGKRILFLKRAQIFVSDIYYALQNIRPLNFTNLNDLTLFADYKIPQLLQAEGVMVYSKELTEKIASEILILAGSREEIEIRAGTIYAGELLLVVLQKFGRDLNSNQLDWILWVQAKNTKFSMPHHKTLTVCY